MSKTERRMSPAVPAIAKMTIERHCQLEYLPDTNHRAGKRTCKHRKYLLSPRGIALQSPGVPKVSFYGKRQIEEDGRKYGTGDEKRL